MRRRTGVVLAAAALAIAVIGFAVIGQQLSALRGELQPLAGLGGEVRRLAGVVEEAHQAADRAAAADARAIDLLAKFGQSAAPAGDGFMRRERAFVTVDRIAVRRQGHGWRTAAIARNEGDTPTRDLRYAGAAGPTPPSPSSGLLLAGSAQPRHLAQAAIGGHASLELPGPVLTPRDRGRTVFLHGIIYYKDVLSDAQHLTQYCWYATLPRRFGAAGPRPQFQPCVHLNCADRECTSGSAE